jgi:hypothetical protein
MQNLTRIEIEHYKPLNTAREEAGRIRRAFRAMSNIPTAKEVLDNHIPEIPHRTR